MSEPTVQEIIAKRIRDHAAYCEHNKRVCDCADIALLRTASAALDTECTARVKAEQEMKQARLAMWTVDGVVIPSNLDLSLGELAASVSRSRDYLRVQLQVAEQARDEARTLAQIGTWHNECRPNREMAARELAKSQEVIDKLADRISELEARLQRLTDGLRRIRGWDMLDATADGPYWKRTIDALLAGDDGS
jgi:predicted transcriptional regulator